MSALTSSFFNEVMDYKKTLFRGPDFLQKHSEYYEWLRHQWMSGFRYDPEFSIPAYPNEQPVGIRELLDDDDDDDVESMEELIADEQAIVNKVSFIHLFIMAKQQGTIPELVKSMTRQFENIQRLEGPARAMEFMSLMEECQGFADKATFVPQTYKLDVVEKGGKRRSEIVCVES